MQCASARPIVYTYPTYPPTSKLKADASYVHKPACDQTDQWSAAAEAELAEDSFAYSGSGNVSISGNLDNAGTT